MNSLQSHNNLAENIKDFLFLEEGLLITIFQVILLFFNQLVQVTAVSIFHDHTQFTSLRLVHIIWSDDIRMRKLFHDSRFLHCILLFLIIHVCDVNLFDYANLLRFKAFAKVSSSKSSLTQKFQFFILFNYFWWFFACSCRFSLSTVHKIMSIFWIIKRINFNYIWMINIIFLCRHSFWLNILTLDWLYFIMDIEIFYPNNKINHITYN